MNRKLIWIIFASTFGIFGCSTGGIKRDVASDYSTVRVDSQKLFQNQFYTLDTTSTLDCLSADKGVFDLSQIKNIIDYYEKLEPGIEVNSVKLLSVQTNPTHKKLIQMLERSCSNEQNPSHCILKKYWEDEESALRILAFFYDTGVAIRRDNSDDFFKFNLSQIKAIEKSYRKIPLFLRKKMNSKKPDSFIPEYLVNGDLPLTFDEMDDKGPLGLVILNWNSIGLSIKNLDKAKSGKAYKDVGYKFIADIRLHMIIHEMGHVIDNFYYDNSDSYSFNMKRITNKKTNINHLDKALPAIWPHHWWRAFNEDDGIVNERYKDPITEKFAEIFTQYILLPEGLRAENPEVYTWLKEDIFENIEYNGYEECTSVAEPLSTFEKITAPMLKKLKK